MPETTEISYRIDGRTDHIAGSPRILIIDDEAAIRESLEPCSRSKASPSAWPPMAPPASSSSRKTSMTCSYSTWHSQVKVASISCRASSKHNPIFPSS